MRREALLRLFYLTLLNALVVALLLMRYVYALPEISGASAWIFLILSIPAHGATLSAFAAVVPLVFTLLLPGRKAATLVGVLCFAALDLVLFIDSSVYSLYRFHLNGMVWELLTGGALTEILPMEGPLLAVALLLPPALLWLQWVLSRLSTVLAKSGTRVRYLLLPLLFCLIAANLLHVWADAAEKTEILTTVRSLPAYRPLTSKRLMRKLGWKGETGVKQPKATVKRGGLNYPREKIVTGQNVTGQNILVIMLDGWRSDDFNPETTPNIAALAKEGTVYSDHWSTGNATRFGVFGFFYGIHATYWHDLLAGQRPPALIETAKNDGYRFGIFASAPLTSPEFDRTVFSSIRDRIPLSTPGEDVVARDRTITKEFEDFLEKGGKGPFFSFLFYDSTHLYAFPPDWPTPFTPYVEKMNHLALNNDTDPAPIRNRLRNSYNFADSLVGEAVAKLKDKGLFDSTIIIITSDHGQEINDTRQNYWGHNSAFDQFQSKVPFIVVWPGKKPETVTRRTSHTDVAPTLMTEVFDVKNPPSDYSNGRLLSNADPRPYVIVSNWDSFALVGRDRVDISLPTGDMETRDGNYKLAKLPPLPRGDMLSALRELGGFYSGAK